MKKKSFFKEPLLISQEEMAMLLGITRSQWSMVALGQRGLSANVKTKLATLVVTANSSSLAKREKLVQVKKQESEIGQVLLNLVQDNKLKQLQVQKKRTRIEEKFEMALNTLHFVNGFQSTIMNETVLKVIASKAKKVLDKNTLALQEVLAIKLEVLKQEEMLLKQRLKKL
jgi:transcriptional regulator with XRE-family HTH domain